MDRKNTRKTSKGSDYRCSFNRLFTILKRDEITLAHVEACAPSPFYDLFKGLHALKKTDRISKSDEQTRILIRCFDAQKDGFQISKEYGGRLSYLTAQDVKLVFGIMCGEVPIEPKDTTTLREKYFVGGKRALETKRIVKVIEDLLTAEKEQKIKSLGDFAKLLTLLALSSIFFASKGEYVPTRYIGYVDNLEEMRKFDWALEIHTMLMKSIRKHHKSDPTKVTGCTLALLAWFYERTRIVDSIRPLAYPRCLRWHLSKRPSEFNKNVVNNVEKNQVIYPIRMWDDGRRCFKNLEEEEGEGEGEEDEDDEDNAQKTEDEEDEEHEKEFVYTSTTELKDAKYEEKTTTRGLVLVNKLLRSKVADLESEKGDLAKRLVDLEIRLILVEAERNDLRDDEKQRLKDFAKLKEKNSRMKEIIRSLSPEEAEKLDKEENMEMTFYESTVETPTPITIVELPEIKTRSMLRSIKKRDDRVTKEAEDFTCFEEQKKHKRIREKNEEAEKTAKRRTVENFKKPVEGRKEKQATPKERPTKSKESKDLEAKGKGNLEELAEAATIEIDSDYEDETNTPSEKVKRLKN